MNLGWVVLTGLVLWAASPVVQGHSNGAPKNHKVCKGLRPHHGGAPPQKQTSPYIVTSSKDKVPVDSAVEVTITSVGNTSSFRGLVMQVRGGPSLASKPLGTFMIEDSVRSKPLHCFAINDTVTHSSPVEKRAITFKWMPPKGLKGTVYFHASVVQAFSVFWIHIVTKVVIGSSGKVDSKWLLPYPPEYPLASQKHSNHWKTLRLQRTFYEGCSSVRKCFGMPGNCVAQASCDAVVSVVEREQIFEFEIFGKNSNYVAISLTDNKDENGNRVTECILMNNNVNLRHSPKYTSESEYTQSQTSLNDVILINSSYVEGTIYCKFSSNQTIEVNGVQYDLKATKYFMTLAMGNIKEGSTNKPLHFNNIMLKSSDNIYLSDVKDLRLINQESNITESETFNFGSWLLNLCYSVTRMI